jgi:hypothetical protein
MIVFSSKYQQIITPIANHSCLYSWQNILLLYNILEIEIITVCPKEQSNSALSKSRRQFHRQNVS